MLRRTLVKRFILGAALLSTLMMLAGTTTAKANDHGRSTQSSFSLSVGNSRSGYGNNNFYGSLSHYDNNNHRDYDYRSFTRDTDRDFRGGTDRNWSRNSRFDNDRDGESDRSSGWWRR